MSIDSHYPFYTPARLLLRVEQDDNADINDHLRKFAVTVRRTQACEHDKLSEAEQRMARLRSRQRQHMFRKRIERRIAKLRAEKSVHQKTLEQAREL